jgi:peptidoglycan/LPS O-acetylase OafA/YrhL
MAGLIVAASAGASSERGWLGRRWAVYLGEISYAVYMTHWFVICVVPIAARRLLGLDLEATTNPLTATTVVAATLMVTLLLSAVVYHKVEVPSRAMLRQRLSGSTERRRQRATSGP